MVLNRIEKECKSSFQTREGKSKVLRESGFANYLLPSGRQQATASGHDMFV